MPHDLAVALPVPQRLAEARLVTVVMAVRYGRHLREGERFLAIYRALRAPPPLVLLSVNLTARKPGKDTAGAMPIFASRSTGTGSLRPSPWPLADAWIIRVMAGWTGS